MIGKQPFQADVIPRYRIIPALAFAIALFSSVFAMWRVDVQVKRRTAEAAMTTSKAVITPFEQRRQLALKKARRAGVEKWVDGRP